MAGLIQSSLSGTSGAVAPSAGNMVSADSFGVDPSLRTVDAPTETVSGQLDTLLSKDSPYMQQARSGAMQTANSRGLLNTSMAAGAGEDAAIKSALPIAAADANTYSSVSGANQNATNVALSQSADAASKAATTNAGNANTIGLQNLKGEQATTLANIEANYKTLIQSSDSVTKMFQTTASSIASIQADPNTSVEQKQAAVNSLTQQLQNQLTVAGSIADIDLVGLLDFSTPAAAPAAAPVAPAPAPAVAPPPPAPPAVSLDSTANGTS